MRRTMAAKILKHIQDPSAEIDQHEMEEEKQMSRDKTRKHKRHETT